MTAVVPPLLLHEKLGHGHFGTVYRGMDSVHGQVAVKVLTRRPEYNDQQWNRFKRGFLSEAQTLSKASHRNVVQVHHITEMPDGDSIYLCMAYCPGGSLQRLFELGPMTLSAVRKAGTEVLMGLGALHARGMLHRDIKPGNILIDAAGVSQLGDFGLVTDDLLLGYGSIAGYSDHIAIEVWRNNLTSAKSDIWALGMTLFRLLHGKSWYEQAPCPRDIIQAGGFAGTLRWLPHIPKIWRRVIRKMMADDTAARYQSCSQALGALSRLPVSPEWTTIVAPELICWNSKVEAGKATWNGGGIRSGSMSGPLGASHSAVVGGGHWADRTVS